MNLLINIKENLDRTLLEIYMKSKSNYVMMVNGLFEVA